MCLPPLWQQELNLFQSEPIKRCHRSMSDTVRSHYRSGSFISARSAMDPPASPRTTGSEAEDDAHPSPPPLVFDEETLPLGEHADPTRDAESRFALYAEKTDHLLGIILERMKDFEAMVRVPPTTEPPSPPNTSVGPTFSTPDATPVRTPATRGAPRPPPESFLSPFQDSWHTSQIGTLFRPSETLQRPLTRALPAIVLQGRRTYQEPADKDEWKLRVKAFNSSQGSWAPNPDEPSMVINFVKRIDTLYLLNKKAYKTLYEHVNSAINLVSNDHQHMLTS